jgi:hypothetical protein
VLQPRYVPRAELEASRTPATLAESNAQVARQSVRRGAQLHAPRKHSEKTPRPTLTTYGLSRSIQQRYLEKRLFAFRSSIIPLTSSSRGVETDIAAGIRIWRASGGPIR